MLFGRGASDKFVGTDYRECTLEEALWDALHVAGYQRVVFTSASTPAYFLDEESRDFISHNVRSSDRQGKGPRAGGSRAAAKRATFDTHHPGPPTDPTPPGGAGRPAETSATGAFGLIQSDPRRKLVLNADVLPLLKTFLRIRDTPTALVIVRAGDFLRFNGTEREFAEWFARWSHTPTAVDNVCILVFTERSGAQAGDFIRSLGYVNVLADCLERQTARPAGHLAGEIIEPDAAEIERMVHLVRLRDKLRIADWREFDRIVAALAAQRDVPGYVWVRRLRRLARLGLALSERELRAQGWVESLPSGQSAWDRLTELTGLDAVKDHIDRLRWRAEAEAKRRREGLLREPGSLHLVFTGGPGTGKTTVARLVGELYRELGILRRGHVHAPEASDLIGMYVGHTAVQTSRAVDEALDGVLFIDEAYRLSEAPGGYGQEAIDTLITRMDNERDRLVVIVAGYPDKMDAFLRSNPGLPRRFPRGNIITFPDYEPDALFTILLGMLRDRGLSWVPELEPLLQRVVSGMYAARDESFGNAGEMRNLVQELETNWARRVRADIAEPVTPDDLPGSYRRFG
ncbi:MAG TPA: AAA family ATPase [Streptosporangiaceae bacterium]|nr:AAA family ATPase [Streptosporangiaceae bacterium]